MTPGWNRLQLLLAFTPDASADVVERRDRVAVVERAERQLQLVAQPVVEREVRRARQLSARKKPQSRSCARCMPSPRYSYWSLSFEPQLAVDAELTRPTSIA